MSLEQRFSSIAAEYRFTPRPEAEPAYLGEDMEDPDLVSTDFDGGVTMHGGLVREEFPSFHLMQPEAFVSFEGRLRDLFEQAQSLAEAYDNFIDDFHICLAQQREIRAQRFPEVMAALREVIADCGNSEARDRLAQLGHAAQARV